MRTVVSFFVLVSLVITLSPLLAYPVHLILENFVDYPFHKLVSHVTLICGLIFSGFYLKYHQMYSRQSFGFSSSKKIFLGNLLQGILAGILVLALLNLFLLLFGVHQIKPNLDYFWSNLFLIIIKAILAGLVKVFFVVPCSVACTKKPVLLLL